MAGFINKPLPLMSLPDLIDVMNSQRKILMHARVGQNRLHLTQLLRAIEKEITTRTKGRAH